MATIIANRICDGWNEFDFFIITGEWFQKLSFPGLIPKFFEFNFSVGGSVPGVDIMPADPRFAQAVRLNHRLTVERNSNREIGVLRLHGFGGWRQHAGGHRGIGALLDQNKGAGQPVGGVTVIHNRLGDF